MCSIFLFLLVCLVVAFCYNLKCPLSVLDSFDKDATIPIRAVSCIGIIMHHTYVSAFADWGGVIVSVFFFISGYGLFVSYDNKGKEYLRNFLKRRIIPILVPFILAIILFHLLGIFFKINYQEMIPLLFKGDTKIILPTSWYIFAIIFVYVEFYLFAKISNNELQLVSLILISTIALMFVSKTFFCWDSHWRISSLALPFGMIVAYKEDEIKCIIINNKSKSLLIMFAIVFVLLLLCLLEFFISAVIYISSVFIPLTIVLLTYFFGEIKCKVLKSIGNISLEIYLVQGVVTFFLKEYVINSLIYIIVSIILSLLLALCLKCVSNPLLYRILARK